MIAKTNGPQKFLQCNTETTKSSGQCHYLAHIRLISCREHQQTARWSIFQW